MDYETLQALISLYRARPDMDLLAIILDEAEGPQAQADVLELLRSVSPEAFTENKFAGIRRSAIRFSLEVRDFELAERLARDSSLPEDKALAARALHRLGRDQEAISLYSQAVDQNPALRDREFEREIGMRGAGRVGGPPAQIIPLSHFSRREGRAEPREMQPESFFGNFDEASLSFSDVAGLDEIKAEIKRRIVMPYLKPSLFERFNQKPGGSLLLYGPPGCGKTLIAKATAGDSDARFLSVNPEDILDKYAGEAEKRLRVLFDEARSTPPAILFFDDFDILGSRRAAKGEAAPALVSALLSELDSSQRNNSGVLVLAATNTPWTLDPAFYRSGRFQRVIFVPPPDAIARKKILSVALMGVPGFERLAFDPLVRKTLGFSGADLVALADWACDKALARVLSGSQEAAVTTSLIKEGIRQFEPSAAAWLKMARAELRRFERQHSLPHYFSVIYRG